MPTMEIINERFARNIRSGCSTSSASPEVSIGGIKVQKFSAFLREIVVPTNFNIVAVAAARQRPDRLRAERGLRGHRHAVRRQRQVPHPHRGPDFSPTEQRVILRLVERDHRGVQEGLERRLPARAGLPALGDAAAVRQHRHAQRDRDLDLFTLEIGDTTGSIHFCIPYSTLEPIRDVLYSTMQGDSPRWTGAGSTC
jgi:flagellar motor switch protein FliM